jgi:ribonuclease HI
MEKGRPVQIGGIKKADGQFIEDMDECARVLMTTHFPDCIEMAEDQTSTHIPVQVSESFLGEIREATTEIKIRWALDCLSPFKSPGEDGIFPALLQKSADISIRILQLLFRASITLDHIPTSWRGTLVTFIPKDGKSSFDTAKAFRPISLMSFILKLLEKLIDRNIRDNVLKDNPIDPDQHAYQTGKDTNSALHHLITKMETAMAEGATIATVFVDIAGAFDNTDFVIIENALKAKGLRIWEVNWIKNMLRNRIIRAKLGESTVRYNPIQGCPQGGCLPPLIWCIVIDSLIRLLKEKGFSVVAYADDLAISKRTNHKQRKLLVNHMNEAMNILDTWCKMNKLSVNPDKSYVMKHTCKNRKEPIGDIKLNGRIIREVSEFKYLGVTLDKKLDWKKHTENAIARAKKALWASRAMVARNWGLSPKVMMWIYKQIVLPRLTYGCIVWWHRGRLKGEINKLENVQRIALMMVTGANRSTPTCGLAALLGETPLHIKLKTLAIKTCSRMNKNMTWIYEGSNHAHRQIYDVFKQINEDHQIDGANTRWNSDYKYKTVINERSNWRHGLYINNNKNCWYSDGSVRDGRAALGIFNEVLNVKESIRLSDHSTIAQAETRGIEECVRRLVPGRIKEKAVILSDSQAVIKALRNIKVHSETTWSCIQALKDVETSHDVTIAWVPGHSNYQGNEMADRLANEGIDKEVIDINLPIAERLLEKRIDDWEKGEAIKEWNVSKWKKERGPNGEQLLRHSGEYIEGFKDKLAEELIRLRRRDLRVIIAMLTGQGCLNQYLYRIHKRPTPLCESCYLKPESMRHVLSECDALARIRQTVVNNGYPNGLVYRNMNASTLLKISRAIHIHELLTI